MRAHLFVAVVHVCLAVPACAAVEARARLKLQRRIVITAAPALLAAAPPATTAAEVLSAMEPAIPSRSAAKPPPPSDFGLFPEGRPYTHYLENAAKLVSHLQYYAAWSDAAVGPQLDAEITKFAAIYAERPGGLIEVASTPGLTELKLAYDTLAQHFARYGSDTTTPLSEAQASTVYRNAVAASKRLKRAQSTIGRWPNCNGQPLGSRDAYCSTQVL